MNPDDSLHFVWNVAAFIEAYALPPTFVLQIIRSVAWPKMSSGFVVISLAMTTYVRTWHRAARRVFNAFNCTHGAGIQRELGLIYHLVYWATKTTITFYSFLLTSVRDASAKRVLGSTMYNEHHYVSAWKLYCSREVSHVEKLQNVRLCEFLRAVESRVCE